MNYLALFILGTIVGSFLNVVSLRWGKKSFVSERSSCPKCKKKLKWYELVPLLSFIVQWGRCRSCGAGVSWRYPFVEILTGLVFVTVPPIFLAVFCIYIVIALYDLEHKIIPDKLVYLAIALSLVAGISNWVAGVILFVFFASIWFFSRGRAMGFGDAKLALSIGLLLGASRGFSAVILAFWIGALTALPLLIFGKRLTMKSEVPFAPFLILGTWLSLILNLDFLNVAHF